MGIVLIAVVIGLAVGLGAAAVMVRAVQRAAEAGRHDTVQAAVDTVLAVAGEKFADQSHAASRELDLRQQSIAQQFTDVSAELTRMRELVGQLQRDRAEQHGHFAEGIQQAVASTRALAETTQTLREALASSKARGQWGERMADDVLRAAGFVEGVNYRKQTAVAGGGIPDVTFFLPHDRVLHMDVKFPLDNFLRAQQASTDDERQRCEGAFLKDVRQRVKEIGNRQYIDPDETIDAVLLFIPNESIYGFIHERDPQLADAALGQKVILCSPFTLFAVLAVVRQAVDAFMVERTSDEILQCLSGFNGQWEKFSASLDTVGKRFESAQKAFDELSGPRRRQLQRTLDQVDELRNRRGLPPTQVVGRDPVEWAEPDPDPTPMVDVTESDAPPRLRPVRLG